MSDTDLVVVGAGLLGLAHAWHAARRGMKVTVIEREPIAAGASVQNFGMLATIAQRPGPALERALRTRESWHEVAAASGLSLVRSGCLILAAHEDEAAALAAFAAAPRGERVEFLPPGRIAERTPAARAGLLGALWAPDVWKIDQQRAPARIAAWLARAHGVRFRFGTVVEAIDAPTIKTDAGRVTAPRIVVCGGHEFERLFADAFAASGVRTCRLQMLRTAPQPRGWHLGPFILGGLSMARYAAFRALPGMDSVHARLARDKPEHLRHGIHAIACQELDGTVTIGDSHRYDDAPSGTRSAAIDRLILDDLAERVVLPESRIVERWIGRYAHLDGTDVLRLSPQPGVTLATMTNGQGVTHCFGVAEETLGALA